MNWEETILYIRERKEYGELIDKAFLSPDLVHNVEKYRISEEFSSILSIVKSLQPTGKSILDIGSGNGITAISFALEGYKVVAVEPDSSLTIGCGAIQKLKEFYKLDNLEINQGFCEDIEFKSNLFDVVFARQCMHHALDLTVFVKEMGRVLKTGGVFFTVRDHVVFDDNDKERFLQNHPLHKYYHGENAYTAKEYKEAIENAGLTLINEYKYYDSVINYFPKRRDEIENMHSNRIKKVRESLSRRFGNLFFLSHLMLILYKIKNNLNYYDTYDEKKIPGRMYSYLARKS